MHANSRAPGTAVGRYTHSRKVPLLIRELSHGFVVTFTRPIFCHNPYQSSRHAEYGEYLMNKYPFAAMAFAVVALALLSTKPAHAYPGQQQYGTEAKISLKQAETIASKAFPGKIVSEELEKEKGGSGLRYSFDINNGTAVHEVGVDAKTGAVLENSVETDIVAPSASTGIKAPAAMIPLPGGTQGIHFDDMRYFAQLQWVAVPAAQTGDLDLINPKTYAVTVISDVASKQAAPNGDDRGSTSVAYGEGYLFAGDHGRTKIGRAHV